MMIYIFSDHWKRIKPSNIKPGGGATKTGFRPVSAGCDGLLSSGTALIAAERTIPRCDALELDASRVDMVLRRWETLTGGKPGNAASGRSFEDFAREAEAANAR
jgi:hypothetical protein